MRMENGVGERRSPCLLGPGLLVVAQRRQIALPAFRASSARRAKSPQGLWRPDSMWLT